MKPDLVRKPVRHLDGHSSQWMWWIRCPGCGQVGMIDEDQYKGRVSIQCTNCPYHETHDLTSLTFEPPD